MFTEMSSFIGRTWQWMMDDYWIKLDEPINYIVDADTGEMIGGADSVTDEDLKDKDGNPRNIKNESYTIVDYYLRELGNKGVTIQSLRLLGDNGDYSDTEKILQDENNKAILEKYIAEFIRADVITQEPHKRRGKTLVSEKNQNNIDGGVYFYRTKKEPVIEEDKFVDGSYEEYNIPVTDKDYKQMEFMTYEKFMEGLEENDPALRYRFTVDPETDELILAEITTIEEVTALIPLDMGMFNGIAAWFNQQFGKTTTYILNEVRIPYKEYIAKYAMPYEFLINLCNVTQNPEFVYHVALLARDTNIILAVQDNVTMERETEETLTEYTSYKSYTSSDVGTASKTGTHLEKWRTVKTTTVQTPVLMVDTADTWSFYEEFEFTKNITGTLTETGPDVTEYTPSGNILSYVPAHEEMVESYEGVQIPQQVPEHWEGTFVTRTEVSTQLINTTTTFNEPILKRSIEKSKQFLGLLRNDTGECEEDCFEETAWRRQNPKALKCAEEAVFNKEGINVAYRIPNMTRMEQPYSRLVSGIEMLYAVMQSNSTGYDAEDKLLGDNEISESYNVQDQYVAAEDYESAYVVKMQGLVEHMRYLMGFPPNEEYNQELPDAEDNEEEDDDDETIVIPDEGVIASAREIYEFLIGKGFTPESACAILGNIQQESGFNTAASNGTHFGLCQWGDTRWENLKQFAASRGTSWADLNTQLEFLWNELTGVLASVKNDMINLTDVREATSIFCKRFEICGNYGVEVPKRYKYAKYWYSLFVTGENIGGDIGGDTGPTGVVNQKQRELLDILQNLSNYHGIENEDGYCQRFVRTVFEKLGVSGSAGSASEAARKWTVSSDMDHIPVGATVYGRGSSADGHVGIYIGNGMVVHNIGDSNNCSYGGLRGIKCENISSWNRKYHFTGWGWQGGVDLRN